MKKTRFLLLFLISLGILPVAAQQPKYTPKKLVTTLDTTEFKAIESNVLSKTYLQSRPEIWDVDDNNTTPIKFSRPALLCFEGPLVNGKRNGVYSVYVIDSADHHLRYKIWDQPFLDDSLTGIWKFYNLRGTCVGIDSFKNGTLTGLSKRFWIDGKTLMEETQYLKNGRTIIRKYAKGKLYAELPYQNDRLDGIAKTYYDNGHLEEEAMFLKGERNGYRKYYYTSGQLWLEMEFKNGMEWNAIANYDEKGNKRKTGTLKNGNGSLIFYNDDGTVREEVFFKDGLKVK